MYFLYYFADAYYLLKYLLSPSFRRQTHARWKQTPTHHVIYEIGGGVIGLIILLSLASIVIYVMIYRDVAE